MFAVIRENNDRGITHLQTCCTQKVLIVVS